METESSKKPSTRSQSNSCASKHVCFVFNITSTDNNLKYSDEELARCNDDKDGKKIKEAVNIYLQDRSHQ